MQDTQFIGRKAPRAFRREQLIAATISTVARRGLTQTTLSEVAKAAGVSHGLINFHFQTKESLFAETLSHMSNQHRAIWTKALAAAGPAAADRLNALILAEIDEANFCKERLNALCVFWGGAQSQQLYLNQCGDNDRAQIHAFEEACGRLSDEGGYGIDPQLAARVLRVTLEGVKLELMLSAMPYSLDDARRTAFFCAAMLYPRHFSSDGLIPR
jgi:TetR/AcrR family transcriptional repressor of bet genes